MVYGGEFRPIIAGVVDMSSLEQAEAIVGHVFADKQLLEKALTHPSMSKSALALRSYERLEFLGDAVLGLVMAEFLWRNFPDEQEGGLAKRLSVLVSGAVLADIGEELNIGDVIIMTSAEASAGGRSNRANLENVIEALIGALYLDGGVDVAESFIRTYWFPRAKDMTEPPQDPKTQLQELAQGNGKPLPSYTVVESVGPPHSPTFTVQLEVEGYAPVVAKGASKKNAEREAAILLLTQIEDQ